MDHLGQESIEVLQVKLKSFDGWTQERDAMLQYLSVTQTQIQELMEEVVTLQLENDDLEEEKQELRQEAEARIMPITSLNDLQKDMSEKEVSWKRVESSLRSKIGSLEAEMAVIKESKQETEKTTQEAIRVLEFTVASRTSIGSIPPSTLPCQGQNQLDLFKVGRLAIPCC